MQEAKKLKFLFAINPISGGQDKSTWESGIRAFFEKQPHSAELFLLDGKNDDTELPKHIESYRPDRLVAVGGDGTIKFVAEHALNAKIPLGIIPAGSANGMAKELNIPATLEGSLEVLVNGLEKPIDLICVNGTEHCLHLSDIGMNAQLVKYFDEGKMRGKIGYARGVLRVLMRRRLLKLQINTGDEVVHRAAFMVVLANARMYGTGAVINPDGDVADGKFEVVVIRKLSLLSILRMFIHFRPFDPKYIEIFPATSVHIVTKRKAYFQIDGEYRGRIRELTAEIWPGHLRVILPEKAKI
ncbi:diacylglycerol/lipid kinase family protein [Larkinella rosea]|uniref:Diacylglycerol kinase family lipid kinase n=1 Tax=Larkinella rosea TaxID=2025312 RepID=A0A3P1BMT8_9BACT|nr:diacylglycerol kinase family protein [Larkinella rosea]RRB02372.1 diacylglycerol kinase family lipid kinase [Larkinella rosea]